MNKSGRWFVVIAALLGGLAVGRSMPEGAASRLGGLVARQKMSEGGEPPIANQGSAPSSESAATAKADVAKSAGKSMADEAEARSLWQQYASAGNQDVAMAGKNLLSALKRWLAKDPRAASEFVFGLKGQRAVGLMIDFARAIDPTQAAQVFGVLLKHPELWEAWGLGSAILGSYAKTDPQAAWHESTTEGRIFPLAAGAIAQSWVKLDPQRALTFAASIANVRLKSEFTRAALMSWGRDDAKAFLAWLGAQPDISSWAEQVQWAAINLKSEEDLRTVVKLVPPAVLEIDNSGPFTSYPDGIWMSRLDWIEKLPEGAARKALLTHAAKSLSQSDPEKAASLVGQLPPGKERNNAMSNIAAYRAAISPEDGMAYASSIEDERARTLALRSAVQTWALNDPASAATWLATCENEQVRSVLYAVGQTWAEEDPDGAAAFALANESADRKTRGTVYGKMLGSVMEEWVKQDAYGASLWTSQLQAGPQKDRAMSALAMGAMGVEPDGAMSWAMSIAGEAVRMYTLLNCFETWATSNQLAAAAWLQNAAVDEATRSVLRNSLQRQKASRSPGSDWTWSRGMTVVY